MLLEAKPETNIPTSTPVCKTSSQSQLTHEEATTLPHNQTQVINTEECTPVLPNFGWESIPGEKDPIPYIVRDSESYVAWMIYENKILKRFTPILSNMVLAFITADLKQMSEAEAAMFNEINLKHCDGNLAGQDYRFLSEAPMLSLEDVKTSLNFFLTCYNVVCLTKINNDLFGFLKISGENEVAFVWNKNTQLVPLFYFEGQSEYLDSKSINLTDKWQVRYMRFCCMAQGVRQDYYNASPMKVVDFEYVRSLFPENTPVECSWPKDFNQDILGPESKTLLPLTKSNQPTNQLLTNSTQSYENSLTPRLGGNNENRIPRPEKHWDQTVNSALPQLTNMMLGQPVNNQSRMLRPQTANSVQSHVNTQSGLGNNNQSGIKRSVTQNSELKKRLRCEIKSPPLKVTETSNQIASSSSTQQAQTKALHDTAAVTISLMSEKENTAQNTSSTQQKQSASISMSVQTESYVPHYGQNVNSSTTSNFNQTGIRAVQPPNGPLYGPLNRPALPPPYAHNLYRGTSPQLPSYQMQAPTIRYSQRTGAPEYSLSNSGWNGTGHTAYPANIPSTRYPQQNPATYNPAVMRSNNQYRNQNQSPTNSFQISSALYAQISAYFQQNVLSKPKSSPILLSALTEMFMNSCVVSGSELARLSTLRSWIYKTFADMCYKAGYFPHPSPSNIRTNSQVQGNTNKVVKTLQCEHVNSAGNYVVKILPLGSQQIYGITLSTVSDKYIVNWGDVVNKFRLMFKDYQSYMSKIEPTTLYELNNAQKQQWDKLVNSGLVCPNPYNFYFIEYQPIILMLTKNNCIH